MEYWKLDRNQTVVQDIFVLDEKKYDLEGKITLTRRGSKMYLHEIELFVTGEHNNKFQLETAIFCDKVLKNNKSYYFVLVNMLESGSINHKQVKLNPRNVVFESGTIIDFLVRENQSSSDLITKCSDIDLFAMSPNPDHKKGNIIVGQP